MRRQCLSLVACLLLTGGLSGCCLFCPWHCGAGGCYAQPYSGGSYGACVLPGGCPECATGIYAAQLDPVHRARAVRLQRIRRHRGYAYGRMPRHRHPHYGQHGGYGYGGYGDMLLDDAYGYGGDMPYGDMAMGYGDEMLFDGAAGMAGMSPEFMGMDSGWMASSPCNCQDGMNFSGELMEGGWIEGMPTPNSLQPNPANVTPQTVPMGEPQAMPREEVVPDPVPVTHEQYYFPAPQLTPSSISGSESDDGTTIEASNAGSPIQPVLWVPSGL